MGLLPTFPDFFDFHELDYEVYSSYVDSHDPYSDFNFVSLHSWNTKNSCLVSTHNNNLILSFHDYLQDSKTLTFIGNKDVIQTARELLKFAFENDGYSNKLVCVPELVALSLIDQPGINVIEDIDNHDYILSAKNYMTLEGKKFSNKRKNMHKFEKLYGTSCETRIVDVSVESNRDAIRKLAFEWAFMGSQGSVNAQYELDAIARILDAYNWLNKKINMQCLGLYIDGKLEGFCIFEVHDKYAITHFGKANLNFSKAYEYMMIQTLRHIYSKHGVDTVNNEQDLGIEGLRQSKRSQHPVGYLKKYIIS